MGKISFDGILADANGKQLAVDCNISLPDVSGAEAIVSIQVPLKETQHPELTNPCSVKGSAGSTGIEIDGLWYRRFPLGGTTRKLERDVLEINHIRSLRIRDAHRRSESTSIMFHLSPVEFFKRHSKSTMTRYSSIPSQSVELFRIHVNGLGEIVFLKQWAVHHIDVGTTSANIHSGFYARVACQNADLQNIDVLVETFREVLTALAILFRQAINLLAWETRCPIGAETLWMEPLQPNLAPYMGLEPRSFIAYPEEFECCAQALVNGHLAKDKRVRDLIRHLSVSVAPHVKVPARTRLLSMFAALELVIGMVKLSAADKQKLAGSNAELVEHLQHMRKTIENAATEFTMALTERVDGFIKSVKSGRPSFSVKLAATFQEYPALAAYVADLWPIEGSDASPGLKEIRNKVTHGVYGNIDAQALAVANWHFSILIERLIFVMVGAEVPRGIRQDSYLLTRDEWYGRDYWTMLQKAALK